MPRLSEAEVHWRTFGHELTEKNFPSTNTFNLNLPEMDSIQKFNGKAAAYTAGRPDYSENLIDCLYGKYGFSKDFVIADIGSGTGKFSRQLLDRQSEVYCVEPNENMRREAEKNLREYKNFHSVSGCAEKTTLESNFVDCVTVAQAFHWFDVPKFKRECSWILKNGGKVFLIWNFRDQEDLLNREWERLFSTFCPDFRGFSNGMMRDDEKIKRFFEKGYEKESFEHPLRFNRQMFLERCKSSSYSLAANDENFECYLSEMNALFDKYEKNGWISISNRSVAYVGKVL